MPMPKVSLRMVAVAALAAQGTTVKLPVPRQ
jgi:hypothetical protein